jgi:putative DNA primase/helicase
VVPIQPGGNKKPAMRWEALQHERLTQPQVDGYWRPGSEYGVALICGAVSGGLEMTELEMDAAGADSLDAVARECDTRGVRHVWDQLFNSGYMEWTPSGGIHLLYRIADHDIPGNTKLAMRTAGDGELNDEERRQRVQRPDQVFWRTLAETRGEGGYVVVAPTSGACHKSGEPWMVIAGRLGEVPTITWAQRQAIHAAINAALDQTPPTPPPAPRQAVVVRDNPGELRPGDDWEIQNDWEDSWFTGQGWRVSHRVGGETFWTRPGKEVRDGHSASTGYKGDKDRLYVWSSATGLPTEQPLSKFYVYAYYHFGGDMARAATQLRRDGYGSTSTNSSTASALAELVPNATASKSLMPWTPDAQRPVSLPPQGGIDLTDTGSGRRMKDKYGDHFRYNTREKAWYRWSELTPDGQPQGAWVKDEHFHIWRAAVDCAEDAVRLAQQQLNAAELVGDDDLVKTCKKRLHDATMLKNKGKLDAAITMFSTEPGMALTTDVFDRDVNLLNLPNGTFDLANQELLPHDPANLLTLTMGASYDKDAQCPDFRQFMVDAFPDSDVRNYVQRALGYTLLGTASERTLFLLHGPSGTGKSVLTSVMTSVFGEYGVTAPASTFRLKKQSDTLDLHRLRGARFVATSEMPEGQQLDEDLIKRVSGGDMVTSRGHYEAFTEWKPSCVVWIATNYLPKVNADDDAIWRRAKTVTMNSQFGRNGIPMILGYADILKQEADGIFNWLLEGLQAYLMRGLDEPEVITKEINAYRIDMNLAASFVRDKEEEGVLVRDGVAETRSSQIWAMFEQYCEENHHPRLGARRFQNQLKTLGFEPLKVGGKAYWRGVRVNVEYGVLGSIR